ncbi:hypothetical protein VaNZ11_002229 [Volvox africanus]|uniref:Uncharacterized protein n=1 Tax=Volvox africanus TaxID=51714 RepID=A0ABQ5RRF7_9CHLO|nr:hypothetical protein VaNZ11_002229 [Volvox africanus]
MISHSVVARHTALGAGACYFVSAAGWKAGLLGFNLEATASAHSELSRAVAPSSTKSEAETLPCLDQGTVCCNLPEGSACRCSSALATTSSSRTLPWSNLLHRSLSLTGLPAWRLLPSPTSSAWDSVAPWPAAGGVSVRRRIHTSTPVGGAAAVSAAVAAAAAAAEAAAADRKAAAATAVAASARPPAARRQQQLSPHAYEFQRRFFQLVNSGFTAAMASTSDGGSSGGSDSAAEAVAHTTNSQAIRMLLAWLEEGRMTAAAEHQQAAAEGEGSAAAAPSLPARPLPGAVAAPYRLDQQVIDRAMEVLWRLYHREGLQTARKRGGADNDHSGSAAAGGTAAPVGGPMGLGELLNAAEGLAAAAPAMGLTFKRPHYELLVELYGKRALQEPSSRRGLAQRLLAVRQQMVQQLMPLSQSSLNTVLQAVRTDPLANTPTKLRWALRLVERDLPVLPLVGAAANTPTSTTSTNPARGLARADAGIIPPLQQTLGFLLRTAAREADWSAYSKLEAALVCRTRAPPPYEVLLEALHAASAAGGSGSRLALGFLAQIEQLEAKGQQTTGSHQQQQKRGSGWFQQQQQGAHQQQPQQQQRWQEWEAENRLDRELRSLRQLVHIGVEQGDEQLAKKSYDRLRRQFWREHPAVAIATAKAATAPVAAKEMKEAAAGAVVARGTEGDSSGDGEVEDAAKAIPVAAQGYAVVLEAAETCPAPPGATLELLSLALSRHDWRGVLDHVAALAELQSLVQRSRGLVGRLLLEDTGTLEGLTSAYGGLGAVSQALIRSEDDTVAYYTELLRRVGAAAAAGAAAPFAGSSVPFGPPLRAAAARADLSSVAAIVRQMRELHCGPGPDSYAAVVEASLRSGKPERVPGLIGLMLDEELVPTAPLWNVQLKTATEAGDVGALITVSEQALSLAEENRRARQGIADINEEVLATASSLAESRADSRAAAAIKLLRLRGEEFRRQRAERRQRTSVEVRAASWRNRRTAEAEALRRNAASLLPPAEESAPFLSTRRRFQADGPRGREQQQQQQHEGGGGRQQE